MLYLSETASDSDRILFEQLYQSLHLPICKCIKKLLKNKRDAEDAMQETWLCVIRDIGRYHRMDDASRAAYIMRIARNRAISIYRSNRRDEDMLCEAELSGIGDDTPLFEACEAEGVSRVLACMEMLTEPQRDVLSLYYLHQHTLKEIAALLNLSEAAATSRWARGRARLMELLKGE